MKRFRVRARSFQYSVVTGRGAWRALRAFGGAGYSSIFVMTEKALWQRWSKLFRRESGLRKARILFVPAGENSKSLRMAGQVAGELLECGADRRSLLIALGGGVVGDLGGFVASTYMRGIDLVQAPTTVVAQVDSAIGGKTGVNLGAMKNLIGTFHPPRIVVAEPIVLTSLEPRAFRSGLYEMVKHGMLAGSPLFDELEAKLGTLRPDDMTVLEPLLASAAKVKVDVVSRDEREARLRMALNLGHTFGHAIEEATGYRRFLHGEAIGWGLLVIIRLGERLKLLGQRDAERMARLVTKVGRLPPLRDLDPRKVLPLLSRDKKAIGGRIQWVIPERIGRVRIVTGIAPREVAAAFREVQKTPWPLGEAHA
ncbi:MAG: 3-dehydroquinate synthase [Terriglobia bacterium]